ncbi:MAG: tRNA-dihydrouridine synthase [Chloroflexota bacterium]
MIVDRAISEKSISKFFWNELPQPVVGLAPMDGVSDHPFRHIQKKYGRPPVVFTEFTSVEGVCLGNFRTLRDFLYDETQRPIVAQIYGHVPDYFRQTAILLCQLGFDGIDINMGCPAKNIANSGSGAGLIRTPDLAQTIVRATQQGILEWSNGATVDDCTDLSQEIRAEVKNRQARLPMIYQQHDTIPLSIKTRTGYETPVTESWISTLLELDPALISLHGRTLEQKYSGKADWDEIGKAAQLAKGTSTLVFGNGDVTSKQQAIERSKNYQTHGVLIGRASMGNPYIFCTDQKRFNEKGEPTYPDLCYTLGAVALEHAKLYEKTYSHYTKYQFMPMRKHLSWYAMGIPGARKLRARLVHTHSPDDAATILADLGLPLELEASPINLAY